MKNILIITQKVDVKDDLLGFFVDWIGEFSKNFERVFVITLGKGFYDLPSNVEVFSLGKEVGSSKFARVFTFYRLLITLVPKSNGIFAHMSPIFVIASWPFAMIFRKKIVFWYLHRSVKLKHRLAGMMSFKIVTAARESLRLSGNNIIETGHGINLDRFIFPSRNWSGNQIRILTVGRISGIKNYETLIESARILRDRSLRFEINIVGKPVMPGDTIYLEGLKAMVREYRLEEFIKFSGYVPFSSVADSFRQADYIIGLTPSGGIDKVMLEGMAAGCIPLTSNDVFRKYLGDYSNLLIFGHGDPVDLAEKLADLITSSPDLLKEISDFAVGSVKGGHDYKKVVAKISALI